MKKHVLVLGWLIAVFVTLAYIQDNAMQACITTHSADFCHPSANPPKTSVIVSLAAMPVLFAAAGELAYILYRVAKKVFGR